MEDDYTTFSLLNVGRMYFLSLGVKGLRAGITLLLPQFWMRLSVCLLQGPNGGTGLGGPPGPPGLQV